MKILPIVFGISTSRCTVIRQVLTPHFPYEPDVQGVGKKVRNRYLCTLLVQGYDSVEEAEARSLKCARSLVHIHFGHTVTRLIHSQSTFLLFYLAANPTCVQSIGAHRYGIGPIIATLVKLYLMYRMRGW